MRETGVTEAVGSAGVVVLGTRNRYRNHWTAGRSGEPDMAVLSNVSSIPSVGVRFSPTQPATARGSRRRGAWASASSAGPSPRHLEAAPDGASVHHRTQTTRLDRTTTAPHDVPRRAGATQTLSTLDDTSVTTLATSSPGPPALLGQPQDIEWAIAGGSVGSPTRRHRLLPRYLASAHQGRRVARGSPEPMASHRGCPRPAQPL